MIESYLPDGRFLASFGVQGSGSQMTYRRLRYRLSAVMKILPFRQATL